MSEFLVNTTSTNTHFGSSVTALTNDRFVITWTDFSGSGDDASGAAVRARIFNADGSQSAPEFLVNTTVSNSQARSGAKGARGRPFRRYLDGQ